MPGGRTPRDSRPPQSRRRPPDISPRALFCFLLGSVRLRRLTHPEPAAAAAPISEKSRGFRRFSPPRWLDLRRSGHDSVGGRRTVPPTVPVGMPTRRRRPWTSASIDGETADGRPRAAHPMRGLFVTQFLGSFNDNAWKQIVIFLAIAAAASPAEGQEHTAIAQIILMIPLMVISLPAGVLADRVSKRSVIVGMKVFELVLMLAGMAVLFVRARRGPAGAGDPRPAGRPGRAVQPGQVRDHPRDGAPRTALGGQRLAGDGLEPGDPQRDGRRCRDRPVAGRTAGRRRCRSAA